jgi:anti-anti-sigma factor
MDFVASSLLPKLDSVFLSPAEWDVSNAVVWLRGEHDISTLPALREIMLRAIGHDDADLTLDLSEVTFIDAATVGTIVRTREFLRFWSRSLALRSPSRCARRVLELCDLTDLTDLVDLGRSEATGSARSATALGTWVAVPATEPAELGDISSPPKSTSIPQPVLAQATQTVP